MIAQRALQLHAEGYSYGQMAVLLRASKDKEHFIVDALREAGIPSVSDTAADYRESPEVALLLAALQTIDNPQQDIPLVSVLRSPLVGFSADELMEIRLLSPTGNYYQALLLAAESNIPGSTRVRCFLQRLQQWREWAGQGTLNELLHRLSQENGFYHMLGAMPDGPHRQQNIRLLIAQARDYDANYFAGLFRFVRQIQDGQLLNVKDTTHVREESQDAIQIMTIHKSKGLEFPIVFVAGLSSSFNAQDERDDVIWERELGLGARLADRERRCKYNTLSHLAVERKLSRLALAEELRVLYVAMTRAKDRLILSAALPLSRSTYSRWLQDVDTEQRALPVHKILSARSPLDWLIPALLRHTDAECLRACCGDPGTRLSSQGHWQVSLHAVSSICAPSPSAAISEDMEVVFDEELAQAVARALDYEYPQNELCVYPAKWSVSALNRMARDQAEEESVLLPAAEPELLTAEDPVNPDSSLGADLAAQRGSAYHRVLELLDLQDVSMEGLSRQCLAMQHLLDIHQLDIARLAHFFASDLGQRYCQATRVERERPFTYLLPIAGEAEIMVQGVLDAAFYEDGAWVLLDYKTGGWGKKRTRNCCPVSGTALLLSAGY